MKKLFSKLKIKWKIISSPMFLNSRNDFKLYLQSVKKPLMASYYKQNRIKFNLLVKNEKPIGDKWSFDKDNRKKLPPSVNIPKIVKFKETVHTKNLKKFVLTGDFTLGKELFKFEKNFARLIGTKYALGVNSGTDALKISLKAIGVMPGDEVITAANTFVATVGAITEIGAIPKFVDCDNTFCMDVNLVEKKITKKTKAIVPVHFTGYMTDMPELLKISYKYKIPIIEDACQSILGSINKKKAGTWGITGAFSLHPLKLILHRVIIIKVKYLLLAKL